MCEQCCANIAPPCVCPYLKLPENSNLELWFSKGVKEKTAKFESTLSCKTLWNICKIPRLHVIAMIFHLSHAGYSDIRIKSAKNREAQEEIYWFTYPLLDSPLHCGSSYLLLL